jgi:RNA-directed DNA polymerase
MRVLYVEGVAIHDGPEPCVGRPRGRRRSVGRGRAGWAIEPRNQWFGVPTLSQQAEGNIAGGVMRESSGDPARSENLGMHGDLHAREPGGPTITRPEVGAGREGNAEAVIP